MNTRLSVRSLNLNIVPRVPTTRRIQALESGRHDQAHPRCGTFTSTEVVYGVTDPDVTRLPEYGVSP